MRYLASLTFHTKYIWTTPGCVAHGVNRYGCLQQANLLAAHVLRASASWHWCVYHLRDTQCRFASPHSTAQFHQLLRQTNRIVISSSWKQHPGHLSLVLKWSPSPPLTFSFILSTLCLSWGTTLLGGKPFSNCVTNLAYLVTWPFRASGSKQSNLDCGGKKVKIHDKIQASSIIKVLLYLNFFSGP